MALVKQPTPPPTITVLDLIQGENTWCLNAMKICAQRVFDYTWNNPEATAQQVFNLMGLEGGKGIEAHTKMQELIYLVDPIWVALEAPNHYTINANGSVTVGAPK